MLQHLYSEMETLASPVRAKAVSRFFKTAPGQYGTGDKFIGVSVPESRKIARKFLTLSASDLQKLIKNPIHEYRLVGLLILVERFKKASPVTKKEITNYYLRHKNHVNNWDLVDLTADKILGQYLLDKDRSLLYTLANSTQLWERRIAIISTFAFIREQQFQDTFNIAEVLLQDKHDLIHKAVGWMLREIGKRDLNAEEQFLQQYYKIMPRTMLRYAIERFPEEKRKKYLQK